MQNKLTLRIEDKLISKAKTFAKAEGKSISQIVADYFRLLDKKEKLSNSEIPPIVKSLKGSLKDAKIGKEDYHQYLEDKYL